MIKHILIRMSVTLLILFLLALSKNFAWALNVFNFCTAFFFVLSAASLMMDFNKQDSADKEPMKKIEANFLLSCRIAIILGAAAFGMMWQAAFWVFITIVFYSKRKKVADYKIQDRGGYGIVILYDDKKIELSRGFDNTTNNRMELMGVIVALERIGEFVNGYDLTIYSDSKYVINAVEKGWLESWAHANWIRTNGKKLKNDDLWKRFYPLMMQYKFDFEWIKAHNGHPYHDRADLLAQKAATGKRFWKDLSDD